MVEASGILEVGADQPRNVAKKSVQKEDSMAFPEDIAN
jgi:hypothetical protein